MPGMWKFGLVLLIVCLIASMAIAFVRLTTTPTEILGAGFRGLTPKEHRAYLSTAVPYPRNTAIRNSGRGGR